MMKTFNVQQNTYCLSYNFIFLEKLQYYKGLVFNYILLDKRSIKTTVPFKTVGPNYNNCKREPESLLGERFP